MQLRIETLRFPEQALGVWKAGDYRMLQKSAAARQLKRVLVAKARARPGRRFFGEAFVAAHLPHDNGRYSSLKWLTAPVVRAERSHHAAEFRRAIHAAFPGLPALAKRAAALRDALGGKAPVPPDLWLEIGNEHRFIEVKLPGDSVREPQIAGLALIATCLSAVENLSVWVYDLRQEGQASHPMIGDLQNEFRRFCVLCR